MPARSSACRSRKVPNATRRCTLIYADRAAAGPGARKLAEIILGKVADNCRAAT